MVSGFCGLSINMCTVFGSLHSGCFKVALFGVLFRQLKSKLFNRLRQEQWTLKRKCFVDIIKLRTDVGTLLLFVFKQTSA